MSTPPRNTNSPSQMGSAPRHDSAPPRYARAFVVVLVSLMIAWVSSLLPLPYSLTSGVAAVIALVGMIVMVIAAWGSDRRMMAVITAAVGIPACTVLIAAAAFSALMYGPMKAYQDCVGTAVTAQAEKSCRDDLPANVGNWFAR